MREREKEKGENSVGERVRERKGIRKEEFEASEEGEERVGNERENKELVTWKWR